MKKHFLNKKISTLNGAVIIAVWAIITVGGALTYQYYTQDDSQLSVNYSPMMFKFRNYPAPVSVLGKIAEADYASIKNANLFKDRMRDAMGSEINFAGHYVMSLWGCGGSCKMGIVLDARNGKLYNLPGVASCGIDFRADSKLLVIDIDQECTQKLGLVTKYFVWERE